MLRRYTPFSLSLCCSDAPPYAYTAIHVSQTSQSPYPPSRQPRDPRQTPVDRSSHREGKGDSLTGRGAACNFSVIARMYISVYNNIICEDLMEPCLCVVDVYRVTSSCAASVHAAAVGARLEVLRSLLHAALPRPVIKSYGCCANHLFPDVQRDPAVSHCLGTPLEAEEGEMWDIANHLEGYSLTDIHVRLLSTFEILPCAEVYVARKCFSSRF